MKKLILIPITLTALTPTIAMVGCNKPTPTEKIQFTAATGQMSSATVGTFQLD
ncbi:MAG: hypothetical protein MJ200_04805 [Mycoplasmoidaceae bacterium]|nr:hypothetical protein [Mycoplasmoidaceae bacterium]